MNELEKSLAEQFAPFAPPNTNFVDQIRYWALALPDQVAFRFLPRGDGEAYEVTYRELDERARAIAARLVAMGLAGKRALMMYPSGLEFVEAFFACHYAHVTPVPAFPPRRNRNMGRINAISANSQAAVALTTDLVISRSDKALANAPSLKKIPWVATESTPNELSSDWVRPKINADDLGLIQYTSGSTGTPKGVLLTHQNLMANCRMISYAFGLTPKNSKGVTWLPTYHDMGLIGMILNPVFIGGEITLMSPLTFLTRPIRWLAAISRYQAGVSGGPSFAYRWCVKKITPEECDTEGLDLSSWKVAFNGAEPIRADVIEAFTEKFSRYGFCHGAHYPCYGMAETSLIVTGGNRTDPPVIRCFDKQQLSQYNVKRLEDDAAQGKHAARLVGCGRVIPSEDICIVHPENKTELPEGKIGEIWIHSPSNGLGYWNRPRETAEVFQARLQPDNGLAYVRSGDLGFFDEGELFVTGRLKDMIIVRGVNRYPQDIEATIESCDELICSGGSAAFAIEHWDRERLVVVCEIDRKKGVDWARLIQKIRSAVTEEHDLPPDAVVLVRNGSVPKTSSGKVQRHACREQYLNDSLLTIAKWTLPDEGDKVDSGVVVPERPARGGKGTSDTQEKIIEAVMNHVRLVAKERARELSPDTNIVVDLGLDSLERLEIARELESTFGGRFPDEVLQEIETIREVAEAIESYIGSEPVARVQKLDEPRVKKRSPDEIPESCYVLEKMPEFLRLQQSRELVAKSGLRNPFFTVHEGKIADTTQVDGRKLISFASYNYLGLSGHPEVCRSAKDAIDQFGTSVSASRIVSGEKTIHKELERELAQFLGVEDVITFPGGHACNESVIGHLVGPGDLIMHDSLAHNSIIQGAQLSGARRRPFQHNQWEEVDEALSEIRHEYRRVLIAIEGLYSMDGDYPDLQKFIEIKKKHKSWLFVDEAHSIGTMGDTGRGLGEVYGVERRDVECWMGTLSKSFGSCGGFIGGTRDLIEYLRYTTPGFVFAAGMPPANVGAALGALRVMQREPERVQRLQENARLFLKLAREAGLDTGLCMETCIIPMITRGSLRALALSQALFDQGINAQPILYPAVAEDETRVRIFMTAAHTEEQIRHAVDVIAREWAKINGQPLAQQEPAI